MTERFVGAIAEALGKDASSIQMGDRFREYAEWDSLAVLSLMAVIEETYGAVLSRRDLDACDTLQDLFDRVTTRNA